MQGFNDTPILLRRVSGRVWGAIPFYATWAAASKIPSAIGFFPA
jgi:hypothetical protein